MKKIVISGSAKLQDSINLWLKYFKDNNYEILDYPKPIDKDKFIDLYPEVFQNFYQNIIKGDVLFIMNEDKNDIVGYIGSAAFSELTFGLIQKLIYKKNIEIFLLKMPSREVSCYEEINLWLNFGWITLYSGDNK